MVRKYELGDILHVVVPRYEMNYVSWLIRESYGGKIVDIFIEIIDSVLDMMFKVYASHASSSYKITNQVHRETNNLEEMDMAESYDLDSLMDMH